MINPKELRIGNQIYCTTNKLNVKVQYPHPAKVVVDVMRPDGGGCDFVDGDLEEFDPILLTVQWMARLGFEWNATDERYYIQIGNTLYLEFDTDFDCFITPESWGGSCPWSAIKHVHQPQNLYFALTGEELAIKN